MSDPIVGHIYKENTMKSIEDIERMSLDELERIADDKSVKVPESLRENVESALMARAILDEGMGKEALQDFSGATSGRNEEAGAEGTLPRIRCLRPVHKIAFAISAAAACVAITLAVPRRPKDTFDDPLLAYAELEKTFSYISTKMGKGMEIASEARPALEKTERIFNDKTIKYNN